MLSLISCENKIKLKTYYGIYIVHFGLNIILVHRRQNKFNCAYTQEILKITIKISLIYRYFRKCLASLYYKKMTFLYINTDSYSVIRLR